MAQPRILGVLLALTTACTGNLVGDGSILSREPSSETPPPGSPQGNPGTTPPITGTGDELWTQHCASCHGAFPSDAAFSRGDVNGDFRLDAAAAVEAHGDGLEAYIAATMPFGNAEACEGGCADLTAAVIRSRVQVAAPLDCEPQALSYGVREFKLLTSTEYARAVEDLLGVPGLDRSVANNDGALGGFHNMRGQTINDTLLDTYMANAEQVAAAAVAAGRPFSCGADVAACGRRFVDEFLYKAFRGPVSEGQRAAYLGLFQRFPDDALAVAVEAALASPLFLYRIEAGVDLESARAAGFYTNVDPTPVTPPAGGGTGGAGATESVAATDLPGSSGSLEGDVLVFRRNGQVGLRFEADFVDPTFIDIEARGSNHGSIWPELKVRADGREIGVQSVNSEQIRSYTFEVTGMAGRKPWVSLAFENDSGEPPYGPNQDANLFIARVSLRTESAAPPAPPPPPTPPAPGEAPLDGVASDAYVLTPYELASALSFMLTGSTPDDILLEAARRDQLTTRTQIEAQVQRLIDSPRGRSHVGDFVTSWFRLDKVLTSARPDVPAFTPEVKAAMLEEVRTHFDHVFYDETVPFREFFGGDYTFLNRTLADFYGVSGNFSNRFERVSVEGRGGPIASGAFMASNAHAERTAPILRAVHARQDALCHYIDPPNAPIAGDDIDDQRAAAQMRVTEREAEAGALSSRDFYFLFTDGIDACAGCHEKIINPMFGMEDFDHVGRRRPAAGAGTVLETIGGLEVPVSLEGTLYGVASTSDQARLQYAGAKDFSNKIAETEAVQACLIRKSFRFLTGLTFNDRDLDTGKQESLTPEQRRSYACIAERLETTLATSGESPRAVFVALATESLLRLRR